MISYAVSRYGGPEVLRRHEGPTPVPGPRELLIRIRATTVSAADSRIRGLRVPRGFAAFVRLAFGLRGPRQPVLGSEFAGDVVAVGPDVTAFAVGDAVFGLSPRMGTHAEYVVVPETAPIARVPDGLSYEDAASLPFGGATMLSFYRRGSLKAGERVLVNGASGAVGVAAVQLAVTRGASVTAVCSAANAALVRELGATRVIDYATTDFTASDERFDVIVDAVGNAPYARIRHLLVPSGRLLLVVGDLPQTLHAAASGVLARHRIVAGSSPERAEDVRALATLVTSGQYRPVIGRRFEFAALADAHRYADSGRKVGSAVVAVSPAP